MTVKSKRNKRQGNQLPRCSRAKQDSPLRGSLKGVNQRGMTLLEKNRPRQMRRGIKPTSGIKLMNGWRSFV